MKCARVWDGIWQRQRFLFLSLAIAASSLHPDPLTSETSSLKENVEVELLWSALVLDQKVCGSQRKAALVTLVGAN